MNPAGAASVAGCCRRLNRRRKKPPAPRARCCSSPTSPPAAPGSRSCWKWLGSGGDKPPSPADCRRDRRILPQQHGQKHEGGRPETIKKRRAGIAADGFQLQSGPGVAQQQPAIPAHRAPPRTDAASEAAIKSGAISGRSTPVRSIQVVNLDGLSNCV